MAKTSTSFQKGQSGNPSGRPKGLTARGALRIALSRETAGGSTRLMEWAEDLCAETDPEMRLSILKFLEGNQPPPETHEPSDADDKPRIIIPGSSGPESRPAAKAGPRKRKPAP